MLVVDGIDMRHLLQERRDVDQRQDDHSARELRWIDGGSQLFQGDDRRILRAVGAGDKSQDRARLGAVDYDDGDIRSRINAGRNLQIPGGSLAHRGGCRADGVRSSLGD
jgi:hypothetical protein